MQPAMYSLRHPGQWPAAASTAPSKLASVGLPQVCQQLGVRLEVVPLTQQYWDRVVSHSISEIKQGRTPNPDVLCNSRWALAGFGGCPGLSLGEGGFPGGRVGTGWVVGGGGAGRNACIMKGRQPR
jgi:hypothetical protein